jgi:5-methyltetrahydrofolate--homocysteine methyltransferase
VAKIIALLPLDYDKAKDIVDTVMIPAITKVGEMFDKKEYFLPQLIFSAEAMEKGLGLLKPALEQAGEKARPVSTYIILATVEGDIHDIGKNIVALMLNNHGFSVIDLGKDVSADKIIKRFKKDGNDGIKIIGLSALMTTTMVKMKEVISALRETGFKGEFIIGGAVVTPDYAKSIGAIYARDGVDAVRIAKRVISEK